MYILFQGKFYSIYSKKGKKTTTTTSLNLAKTRLYIYIYLSRVATLSLASRRRRRGIASNSSAGNSVQEREREGERNRRLPRRFAAKTTALRGRWLSRIALPVIASAGYEDYFVFCYGELCLFIVGYIRRFYYTGLKVYCVMQCILCARGGTVYIISVVYINKFCIPNFINRCLVYRYMYILISSVDCIRS